MAKSLSGGRPAPAAAASGVSARIVALGAAMYVLSGVTQPLLMTVAKDAGLADPTCQLYMFFYQLGPTAVGLSLCFGGGPPIRWPSKWTVLRAASIGAIDIAAQVPPSPLA